jgi:tetratricopeptide (TPR) repeat protein
MQPSSAIPFAQLQQQLATHWQAFCATPSVRLCRWLTAPAERVLLHDYLVGLSAGDKPALLPLEPGTWPAAGGAAIYWLLELPSEAERLLQAQLKSDRSQRFIVLEDAQQQPLRRLARWFPALVQTVTPDVSLPRLLRELRDSASTDTPEAQFRQQFQRQFEYLTTALARTDERAIEPAAVACRETCQVALRVQVTSPTLALAELAQIQQPQLTSWELAKTSVWLAVGPHYLVQRQPRQALAQYAAALAHSEAGYGAGHAALGLPSIQAWLGLAIAYQQLRQWPLALEALRLALARAHVLGADVLGAEAAHQLGLALDRAGQGRTAVAAYEQALDLTERLPPAQRSKALIQSAGAACLKRLHTTADRQALQARLKLLYGANLPRHSG